MLVRLVFWAGVVGAAVAPVGCAPERESGPKLTGRVVINGQPCRPVSLYDFDVKFTSVEEGPIKKSYVATVEEDGTFAVNGSIGKGIPAGRYRVSVIGPVIDAGGKPTRKYLDTFSDKSTPLEVAITAESRELTIDLDKKSADIR